MVELISNSKEKGLLVRSLSTASMRELYQKVVL